jgi:hypothetical protein
MNSPSAREHQERELRTWLIDRNRAALALLNEMRERGDAANQAASLQRLIQELDQDRPQQRPHFE